MLWSLSRIKPVLPLLACILVWSLLLKPGWAAAASSPQIMVLPFEVNAEQDLQNLRQSLPELLADSLREQGFEVRPLASTQQLLQQEKVEVLSLSTVRNLALLADVGYAVYGSVTQAGQRLSIDARLVDASSPKATKALYVSKEGLIQMLPALQELSDKIKKAVTKQQTIAEIKVTGNNILDKDVVLMRLSLQQGDQYSPQTVNEEVKRLYKSGYFEDIKVQVQEVPDGKQLTFEVQEKPLIRSIEIQGNDALDRDDILEAMSTKTGSVLNPKVLAQDLDKIRELYRKKGYYRAKADYEQKELSPGKAELVISIEEGKKLYIEKIRIQGAEKLAPDDLKDQLALSERGLFSWITGGGVLKEELLNRDAAALEAYYANRGFFDVQVGQPEVEYAKDGIHITFQVVEGPRYSVGDVDFQGDLITEKKSLFNLVKIDDLAAKDDYFDRSVIREDTQNLADFYTNYGYAFAEATTDIRKDTEAKTIDVTYRLHKRQKVFIRRVLITGNHKTRDNVIRRQMAITGGDQFSGRKISLSKQRLNKLDYFENVEINTVPAQEPEELDLQIKVKEKSTGSLSAGAGYSSVENVFFTGQIQERNLLGKGYGISFKGSFSSRTTLFQFGFWNPHLYDTRLGFGFDAYNTRRDYDEYDLDTTGGRLKFAYTIGQYSRLFWNLRMERYTLDDVAADASQEIKDIEGSNWLRSLSVSATRDTTNRRFHPTKGTKNTLSVEYAGGLLGGDDNFVKTGYDFTIYQNIWWKLVGSWHGKIGYIFENTGEEPPDFERFYLGGINSVRGYEYRDIAAQDDQGNDIGGYKTFYQNLELVFPIKEDMGLLGLLFFDAGKVWGQDESMDFDLYKSVGAGIRWNSPMGPLRLEYGYPLDDLKDNDGQFEFSVGQSF